MNPERAVPSDKILNPSDFAPLQDAIQEIEAIAKNFDNSELYINQTASVDNALSQAEKLTSRQERAAVVLATHGVAVDYERGLSIPGLLTADDGELGFISSTEISSFNLEDSIVALSACDTATGFTDQSDLYFTGFVQAFANSGSEIILASLWPVVSSSSKTVTENFFSALNDNDPLMSAGIGKQAVNDDALSLPFVFMYP